MKGQQITPGILCGATGTFTPSGRSVNWYYYFGNCVAVFIRAENTCVTRQGLSYSIQPVAKYVDSNSAFWTWGNYHRVDLWTHWAHSKMDLLKNYIDHLTLETISVTGGPQWPFGSPGISFE